MVDYSKWDHIEVSDDEDDTHPNIDTPSLFRWRHQARVQRMEEAQQKREKLDRETAENKRQMEQVKKKLQEVSLQSEKEKQEILSKQLKDIESKQTSLKKQDEDLTKETKLMRNVDTLSKPGFTKTIINKSSAKKEEELSENEKAARSQQFMDKHEKEIKHFGMLEDYMESQDYLVKHPHLACEDTANYLALWCINLEVQEKHSLMSRVAHQTVIMQYILELARQLETDPRRCVPSFFTKMKKARTDYPEYIAAFEDELSSFKKRVKERAEARIEKAMKEAEEEERKERLGPGGLDPIEVMETLPPELKECFETKDVSMLQKVLTSMPPEDAQYHFKRCIDSGLWVTNAKEAESQGTGDESQRSEEASGGGDNAGSDDSGEYHDAEEEAEK